MVEHLIELIASAKEMREKQASEEKKGEGEEAKTQDKAEMKVTEDIKK